MPLLRVLYAHVAASCSLLAAMLRHRQGAERVQPAPGPRGAPRLLAPRLAQELAPRAEDLGHRHK